VTFFPRRRKSGCRNDHLAYFIDNVVDQLDLSELFAGYEGSTTVPPADDDWDVSVRLLRWDPVVAPAGTSPLRGCRLPSEAGAAGCLRYPWMSYRLTQPENRERYRKRQQSVEPVFEQIKHARGLRHFLLRGLDKVAAVWQLDCAAHTPPGLLTVLVPCQTSVYSRG